MAIATNLVSFLAVAALLATMANAATYTVGEASGWRLGVNYTTWASGKTFRVGDQLEFMYTPGYHNVLYVSQQDYDSCRNSSAKDSENSGQTILTLLREGQLHIICGIQDHCKQGMKFIVNILGYSSPPRSSGSISAEKFNFLGSFALAFGSMILAFIY